MEHAWQKLLLYLYNDGLSWFSALPSTDWRREFVRRHETIEQLNVELMTESWAIQHCLRGTSDPSDAGTKKGFVIPPCKHDEASLTVLVPFILRNSQAPKLSLQLGVLNNSKFFGYRFESPENFEEHNFHHVQPVQAFGHGPPLGMSADWYPHRYPTFPLIAAEGLELVAALLVSIREWTKLVELTTSNQLSHEVKRAMSGFLQRVRPAA